MTECPDCKGTGDTNLNRHERQWDKCPRCGGEGELPDETMTAKPKVHDSKRPERPSIHYPQVADDYRATMEAWADQMEAYCDTQDTAIEVYLGVIASQQAKIAELERLADQVAEETAEQLGFGFE